MIRSECFYERVVIEFFCGDVSLFGGDKDWSDLDTSTGETLLKSFTGENATRYKIFFDRLKGAICHCAIRSWDGKRNQDINIAL